MSTVLLSIHPRYSTLILSGAKTAELRRVLPARSDVDRVVLYATSPTKRIVGEVAVLGFVSAPKAELWDQYFVQAQVTKEDFDRYFAGVEQAHAMLLDKPVTYAEPIDPRAKDPSWRAPQSFCYLADDWRDQWTTN